MGWLVVVSEPVPGVRFEMPPPPDRKIVRFRVLGYFLPWQVNGVIKDGGENLTSDCNYGGYPEGFRLRARVLQAEIAKLSKAQTFEVDWTALQNRDPDEWLTVAAWDES